MRDQDKNGEEPHRGRGGGKMCLDHRRRKGGEDKEGRGGDEGGDSDRGREEERE